MPWQIFTAAQLHPFINIHKQTKRRRFNVHPTSFMSFLEELFIWCGCNDAFKFKFFTLTNYTHTDLSSTLSEYTLQNDGDPNFPNKVDVSRYFTLVAVIYLYKLATVHLTKIELLKFYEDTSLGKLMVTFLYYRLDYEETIWRRVELSLIKAW